MLKRYDLLRLKMLKESNFFYFPDTSYISKKIFFNLWARKFLNVASNFSKVFRFKKDLLFFFLLFDKFKKLNFPKNFWPFRIFASIFNFGFDKKLQQPIIYFDAGLNKKVLGRFLKVLSVRHFLKPKYLKYLGFNSFKIKHPKELASVFFWGGLDFSTKLSLLDLNNKLFQSESALKLFYLWI